MFKLVAVNFLTIISFCLPLCAPLCLPLCLLSGQESASDDINEFPDEEIFSGLFSDNNVRSRLVSFLGVERRGPNEETEELKDWLNQLDEPNEQRRMLALLEDSSASKRRIAGLFESHIDDVFADTLNEPAQEFVEHFAHPTETERLFLADIPETVADLLMCRIALYRAMLAGLHGQLAELAEYSDLDISTMYGEYTIHDEAKDLTVRLGDLSEMQAARIAHLLQDLNNDKLQSVYVDVISRERPARRVMRLYEDPAMVKPQMPSVRIFRMTVAHILDNLDRIVDPE